MERDKVCFSIVCRYFFLTLLEGWHLPGFDDSHWAVGKPTTGISTAGVSFYRYNLITSDVLDAF